MAFGRIRHRKSQALPKPQMTSMMDMFTIILIFLLFSFSDQPEITGLDNRMELPVSISELNHVETVKVILSTESLKIGDRIIARVENGNIVGLNPKDLKSSPVFQELEACSKTLSAQGEGKDGSKPILFLCDKKLSFKTINQVTKTAAMAGFPNFQFAVLNR